MPVPVLEDTTSSQQLADASPAFDYPAAVDADDLLIVCMTADANTGTNTTIAPSGDITELDEVEDNNTIQGVSVNVGYRQALGSEDGGTFEYTLNRAEDSVCHVLRISNWNTASAPEAAAAFVGLGGGSTTFNPPAITPSWGEDDNLYIIFMAWYDGGVAIDTLTASYTGTTPTASSTGATADDASLATATRALTASTTEDPGNTTMDATAFGYVTTVAVRGGAGGGGGTILPQVMQQYYRKGLRLVNGIWRPDPVIWTPEPAVADYRKAA